MLLLWSVSDRDGWTACLLFVFFQAEDGIRYLVRSRGLGDVYKRQSMPSWNGWPSSKSARASAWTFTTASSSRFMLLACCLLYTSDAADERSSVDLGGRRILKKKTSRALIVTRCPRDTHGQGSSTLAYHLGRSHL